MPAAPKRVRITGCSYEQGWYKNAIGQEFDVDNASPPKDFVVWQDYINNTRTWRHIAQSDCEVIYSLTPTVPSSPSSDREVGGFVSASCEGEKCRCGKPAVKKIEEVIMWDDPNKMRHPFTQYVCKEHFDEVMRPYLKRESPSLPADKPESPESFKKWLDYNCDPHNATAVDSAPFVEWLDKEIEGTGFPDVFTRKLIAVKQKYLSLRQPQALPIEEGGEMPSELNEWMSEEEDKIDNIEHMFGYRLGAVAMWKRIGFEREEALTLAGKMGEGWRRETQELSSLRTQLQSLTEERDAIKTAYAEQREELDKALSSMRECYYDGFNQAHYSHLHPDVCPPKELERAANEYFNKKEGK